MARVIEVTGKDIEEAKKVGFKSIGVASRTCYF